MKKMLLLLVLCQTCLASAQNCSVIYVNIAATGASDGSSWQNAFTNLQDAITESANCLELGVEIWVAQGIYLPDIGETQVAGNRYATYYLLDNIVLLGGFTGVETLSSQRNWQNNETILSGDIGAPGDSTDNSYTVITAIGNIETAILDGFTIRDGNASESGFPLEDPTRSGGGMHNSFGNPTIRNCIFRNNTARNYGGGLYNENGNPTLTHCTLLQNRASYGGGMKTTDADPNLIDCSFNSNKASFGGGLEIEHGASVLQRCTISGNDAGFGGGIRITGVHADPVLSNCVISGNKAGFGGGLLHDNGIVNLYSCTLAGNRASAQGGGIRCLATSVFTNSIIWGNMADLEGNQIWNDEDGSTQLIYSCFRNGANDVVPGGGFTADANSTTADPLFVTPLPLELLPATGGDYRLRSSSLALNSGDNASIINQATDISGNPRIANGTVDMGAYELQSASLPCPGGPRLYVNSAATPGGDGTSWGSAFKYLQDALMKGAGCPDVSEIWVARGLYLPDQGEDFAAGNQDAAFQLHNGLAVYGGFSGNETALEQRAWQTYLTILSGDIGMVDTPDDNSYTVVFASGTDNSAIIDGVVIRDGRSPELAANYPRGCGGGIYNEGGSPVIRNCTFQNNFAATTGGGMFNWRNSQPIISNCSFVGNEKSGMSNFMSAPVVNACTFTGNNADFGGGVRNYENSTPTFMNCVFSGNTASFGGAVYNHENNPNFTNCLFSGNKANFGGAISNLGEANQSYTNCTFSGNQATIASAIHNQAIGNDSLVFRNCIIWGNTSNDGAQIRSTGMATITLLSSNYPGNPGSVVVSGDFLPDANCLTENPLFLLPVSAGTAPTTAGNYRLSPCSPLINEGSNDLIPTGTLTDLDQESRIVSGLVDLGAYEFRDTQNVQLPQISLDLVQPACSDIPAGSVSASVTSGAMPYTYLWSGGQMTPSLTDLAPGDYALTVTDNSGCKSSIGFSITAPAPLESATQNIQDALCGVQNGEASVTVSGGTPPYTYLWSGGQTAATATGLSGGIQTVSITDANGCVQTNTVTIAQSEAVEAFISGALLVSCLGNDGRLSVQAEGGSGAISYLWSNDETTETINGLSVGDYSVTVTDSLGCTTVVTTNLGAQAPFESQLVNLENVSCHGLADGQATVAPMSGSAPFSFLWDDGQTTATAENLAPGSHSVTLTEGHGCTVTNSITITEPAILEAVIPTFNPVSCLSNDSGQATAAGAGGTGPYQYLWSDGQTTAQANGLEAGNYTVEITDANGCVATNTVTILAPQLPQAVISATQNASACVGNDGTASVEVTGGQAPYTFLWSNGQTLQTATELSAGSYTVVATDAAGCTSTTTASITSPPVFESEIINLENAICNGINNGIATVSVSGGTAPYTYAWDNGATTPTANGLSPGQHTVSVMDASGCTTVETMTIEAIVTIFTTVSLQSSNNCFGDANAAVLVMPANGTAPYDYLWSTGAGTPGINGLAAGTYFVSITDANGCRAVAGAIITQPEPLMLSANGVNGLCGNTNSGSATVQANGGTAPYTYLWSDGQTTATAQDLGPGTYTATVTDSKNCTATTTVSVTAPTPLAASLVNAQPASCVGEADGSASVQASGGIMPYAYLWSDGQMTSTASGLLPGNYNVVILDANNCAVEVPVAITSAVPALNDHIIPDGAILFAIQNDAAYQWIDCNTNQPVPGATAQTFQPEVSGAYAAIITVGACSVQSACVNITVTSLEAPPTTEASIQVFPNPNSGLFSLVLPETAQVLLLNAAGAKLWQNQFVAGRFEIDQQALPSGVYWLQAIRRNKVDTVKVVVE